MSAEEVAYLVCRNCLRTLTVTPSTLATLAGAWRLHDVDGDRYATCPDCNRSSLDTGHVVVDVDGITVHAERMTKPEARALALRLLEVATGGAADSRTLRRPASVDEAPRGGDDG